MHCPLTDFSDVQELYRLSPRVRQIPKEDCRDGTGLKGGGRYAARSGDELDPRRQGRLDGDEQGTSDSASR